MRAAKPDQAKIQTKQNNIRGPLELIVKSLLRVIQTCLQVFELEFLDRVWSCSPGGNKRLMPWARFVGKMTDKILC